MEGRSQAWLVVGGESSGGIIVREGKGTASSQLPERLCTGALVRQLDYSAEAFRLRFERVTGSGPDTGWVSTKIIHKDLVVRTSEGWRVVGGTEKGGITVREGQDTSSRPFNRRLQTGALIKEILFVPESCRLHYRKVKGSGPLTGWVSTRVPDSDMLLRLKDWTWKPGKSLPALDLTKVGSVEEVCAVARKSKQALLKVMEDFGGVLVDAPALRGPDDFGRCLREVVGDGIAKEYPGLVTRPKTGNSVFVTTEVHPNMPVPGHTELAYMPGCWPDYIAFFCEKAPKGMGGQTPAIDMRAVLRDLPPDLVRRFEKGVHTSVNLPPEPGGYFIPSQFNPDAKLGQRFRWISRTWKKFGATREEAVEHAVSSAEACGRKVHVDWDGDWLRRFELMPALAPHPATGEVLWSGYNPRFHWFGTFSQALFDLAFHNRTRRQLRVTAAIGISTAVFGLSRFLARVPGVRNLVPAWLRSPGVTSSLLEDGSAITAWDAFRISRCYNRHLITWRWRPGLFALLDNHRLGHLRTPCDPHEPRKIHTAFGSFTTAAASKP